MRAWATTEGSGAASPVNLAAVAGRPTIIVMAMVRMVAEPPPPSPPTRI